MKLNSLNLLCCPLCKGDLDLNEQKGENEIEEGVLSCQKCKKSFPIGDGLPVFVKPEELDLFNKSFEKSYNYLAPFYSIFITILAGIFMGGERSLRQSYLERLEIKKGGNILETSVGTGDNIPYLKNFLLEEEVDFFGLDFCRGQLKKCKKNIKKWKIPSELFLGNAEDLPFKDESFDVVFHIGGINFFNDRKKAIREMIRVAKPGSRIVISDENEGGGRLLDKCLFKWGKFFEGERPVIVPPLDLVPENMTEVMVDDTVWKGYGYILEFRKP